MKSSEKEHEIMKNPKEKKKPQAKQQARDAEAETTKDRVEITERNEIVQHIYSVGKANNSNLFSVLMIINGKMQRVTVDIAASKSLISADLVRGLELVPSKYNLWSASDDELKLLEECNITCEAGGQKFEHDMIVHNQKAPALTVLLGNDFHDEFKSNVCFFTNQFTLPSKEGVMVLSRVERTSGVTNTCACIQEESDLHDCPIQVIAKEKLTVAPGQDRKIKVKFDPKPPDTRSYFQPREVLAGVLVSWDMLVDPDDSCIWVTNVSDEEVVVSPGLQFGFLRDDLQVRAPKVECQVSGSSGEHIPMIRDQLRVHVNC